jgi:hypothetical protein
MKEGTMEFEMARASTSAIATLIVISGLLIATTILLLMFTWSASHGSVRIDERNLQIRLPFYGRTIPIAHLDLDHAQIAGIENSASSFQPVLRTNGIGLPGYGAGWFRLENGAKALVVLTARQRLLYLPTTDGYSVLLSLKTPEVALAKLRASKAS